ncbi:hypothetical protein J6590_004072 [Homalodisca vitripennis]|nr:hypothetical protein J6590_004072 [Homalodisca vitripennis]
MDVTDSCRSGRHRLSRGRIFSSSRSRNLCTNYLEDRTRSCAASGHKKPPHNHPQAICLELIAKNVCLTSTDSVKPISAFSLSSAFREEKIRGLSEGAFIELSLNDRAV